MSAQRTPRRGMTLLELMIVLVIIVMLAAIAGPRLLGQQKKAGIKTTQAQINNLDTALKMYAVDMSTFPTTEEGLQSLMQAPADENKARKWSGPYLDDEALPVDAWGNAFAYEYPTTKTTRDFPAIWSAGPDGTADTEDDIRNWKGTASGDNSNSTSAEPAANEPAPTEP